MAQVDAVIRKEYSIDPDTLDDDSWCKLYAEYLYINELNHLNMKAAILAAIATLFSNDDNTMDT